MGGTPAGTATGAQTLFGSTMYNLNHQIVDGIIYNLNHRSVEVEKGGKNRESSARCRLRTGGRRMGGAPTGTATGANQRF